jgi:hypothetical protein
MKAESLRRIIPLLLLGGSIPGICSAETIQVKPGADVIQAALAAAQSGDLLLLAPGTYTNTKALNINKPVTVASAYLTSRDDADRDAVVIKGPPALEEWLELSAQPTAAGPARLVGVWVQGNGLHSANITSTWAEILHCKFTGGKDQVSLTRGGGRVAYCHIEGAGDDNIDCDNTRSWMIDHNTLVRAHEDGIEVRLHPDDVAPRTHVFCYNVVAGSGQSGIQLINYAGNSRREFFIHHNVFKDCRGAGVSCMHDEQSQENYQGSGMEERATIYNNTFDGCNAGITLAPRLIILNNIFSHLTKCAVVRGNFVTAGADQPVLDHCLFFGNTADYSAGQIPGSRHVIDKDPLYLDRVNYALQASSPCVDAGTAAYSRAGEKLFSMAPSEYTGGAPDLGAGEYGSDMPVTGRKLPREFTIGPFTVRP